MYVTCMCCYVHQNCLFVLLSVYLTVCLLDTSQAMGALVLDSPVGNEQLAEMAKYAQVSNLVQVSVKCD